MTLLSPGLLAESRRRDSRHAVFSERSFLLSSQATILIRTLNIFVANNVANIRLVGISHSFEFSVVYDENYKCLFLVQGEVSSVQSMLFYL